MAKEDKSFIDNWRRFTPNPVRTTRVNGDTAYAASFVGEADLLVYQTRNRMSLGKLNQLRSQRIFSDGTQITVTSVFGHDIVSIDVSRAVKEVAVTCSITLFNIPETIAPMKYPGEIHAGEVEGIDYIKTYYTTDTNKCPDCADPDFSVCTTTELSIWDALTPAEKEDSTNKCKPFEFVDVTLEYKEGEPNNHCVTSSSECQAEIISLGEDGGGTYFLWKAYTEWGGSFTENGLGYLLLDGFIRNKGIRLCDFNTVVKVDCCEKYTDEYKVIHPELEDLDIHYTSIVVPCGLTETLYAENGCPPYTWSIITGGGSLTPAEDGLSVVYEAPATNPNCIYNPTIKITDRCLKTAQLKLAVNCLTANAGTVWAWDYTGDSWCLYGDDTHKTVYLYDIYYGILGCNGIGSPDILTNPEDPMGLFPTNSPPTTEGGTFCGMSNWGVWGSGCENCYWSYYGDSVWAIGTASCDTSGGLGIAYDGAVCDRRTDEQKEAGCCPINPYTGEPW